MAKPYEDKISQGRQHHLTHIYICCKVLEHIVASQMMSHFENHNILYHLQHGFRSKCSCDTQLIRFVQELASTMANNALTDAIVLDFTKAFDKVPHQCLLNKLHYVGIYKNYLHWTQSFLQGRTQCVVLDGCKSSSASVMSGVPQRTVLVPILFLAYINDITEGIQSSVSCLQTTVYSTMM